MVAYMQPRCHTWLDNGSKNHTPNFCWWLVSSDGGSMQFQAQGMGSREVTSSAQVHCDTEKAAAWVPSLLS